MSLVKKQAWRLISFSDVNIFIANWLLGYGAQPLSNAMQCVANELLIAICNIVDA